MNRRFFMQATAIAALYPLSERLAWAQSSFAPHPENGWRVFEVTTRLEPMVETKTLKAWIPLPSVAEASWFKPMGNVWQGNADKMEVVRDPIYGAQMLGVEWSDDRGSPMVEVTSRFATRDRAIDWTMPQKIAPLDRATHMLFTKATDLLPTDGIVKKTALAITRGAKTDKEQAQAIYEWIVEHTQRDPKTKGCGTGDIRGMLESGNLSGKCADLNALFVGLARAVNLPARDVYGIRVADSKFGYKSLGKSGDITKAQHCRAEVWLSGFGWVPVDPADVRKVVLEEKPGLTLADDIVIAARQKLFGAWEMNWLAYNVAHDVRLPFSAGAKVPFLMYPQAENALGRLDSLDAANFIYKITAKEVLKDS